MEVKEITKKIIHRPRKGDLVINGKLVILVTGYGNYNAGYKCFSGVVVIPNSEFEIGMYSRTWDCEVFKKLSARLNLNIL